MRRITLLIAIFTGAVAVVSAVVIGLLYRVALDQQAVLLSEIAESQARTIEGMALHEERFARFEIPGHGNAFASVVEQLRDANSRFGGFGRTGEFALARREGDSIVFLLNQRNPGADRTDVLPFDGDRAEPMRRALSGASGTLIGLDYRGSTVLAAFEPVSAYGLGIVAKIDLAEVQAPFVRAGLISIAVALVAVVLGSLLFYGITNPVLRQLQESEARQKFAQELAHLGSWSLDLVKNRLTWSDEVYRVFGLQPQEFEATYEAFLGRVHPDDRARVDASYSGSVREGRDEYEVEHRIVREHTGEVRVVHEKCMHIRDRAGKLVRSIGMVHDITERKRAEDALRKSEERLRALYSAMSEGLALHHLIYDDSGRAVDYRIDDVNPAFETITGIERARAIGRLASDIYGTGSAPYIDIYAKVAETGESTQFETEFSPMAKCFHISVFSPGKDIFATVFSDITARKRAERKLAEQATMLASANDAIVGTDAGQRVTFWNRSAELMYGYAEAEALGRVVADLLRPVYLGGITREQLAERIVADGHAEVESIRTARDGRRLSVEAHVIALRDEQGQVTGFVSVDRDVTERNRAAVALREAKETLEVRVRERTAELAAEVEMRKRTEVAVAAERQRLHSVLNMLPAYVVLLAPDHTVPFANRFFEERFGTSQGRRCYDYLFHRIEPCENCESFKALATNGPHHWEWTGPDGRDYDISDFPFKDTDGSPLVMEVGIDITERKRAEQALHKAHDTLELMVAERTAELQRSNADLEQFAYVASHDLQEPLRMVASYVELLGRRYRGRLDEKADKYIAYASGGAKRMHQLVNDLLAYSRVGTRTAPMAAVSLDRVVALARDNLGVAIEQSGAVVAVGPLPEVRGEESQYVQLFQNLLDNAIKFHGAAPPRISVTADTPTSPLDRFVTIRVADNGIGIDPRHAERIFGLFKRLHTLDEYPGTGIGLAVCKRIVERHGGTVRVEPVAGGGSAFVFTLPRQTSDGHASRLAAETQSDGS